MYTRIDSPVLLLKESKASIFFFVSLTAVPINFVEEARYFFPVFAFLGSSTTYLVPCWKTREVEMAFDGRSADFLPFLVSQFCDFWRYCEPAQNEK